MYRITKNQSRYNIWHNNRVKFSSLLYHELLTTMKQLINSSSGPDHESLLRSLLFVRYVEERK